METRSSFLYKRRGSTAAFSIKHSQAEFSRTLILGAYWHCGVKEGSIIQCMVTKLSKQKIARFEEIFKNLGIITILVNCFKQQLVALENGNENKRHESFLKFS